MKKNITLISIACIISALNSCQTVPSETTAQDGAQTVANKSPEEMVKAIKKATPKPETKTVRWNAVSQYSSWDDTERGTEHYTAESGWVISSIKRVKYSKWGGSGYSISKIGAESSSVSDSLIKHTFEDLFKASGGYQQSEAAKYNAEAEMTNAKNFFERNKQIETSSHSKLKLKWKAKGNGNTFDRTRGKIIVAFDITLVKQKTSGDLKAYQEAVLKALAK